MTVVLVGCSESQSFWSRVRWRNMPLVPRGACGGPSSSGDCKVIVESVRWVGEVRTVSEAFGGTTAGTVAGEGAGAGLLLDKTEVPDAWAVARASGAWAIGCPWSVDAPPALVCGAGALEASAPVAVATGCAWSADAAAALGATPMSTSSSALSTSSLASSSLATLGTDSSTTVSTGVSGPGVTSAGFTFDAFFAARVACR
jgi:hypothetical protein